MEIKPNFSVLDFGCGSGSYSLIVSKLVGESGKVYALDIHPLAVKRVRDSAAKLGLTNIETICSDCATGLPDESMEVILLYDIFHMLSNSNNVLKELYRVLIQNGVLSFSDHHMKEGEILGLENLQNLRDKSGYDIVVESGNLRQVYQAANRLDLWSLLEEIRNKEESIITVQSKVTGILKKYYEQ